jgi:hypothetical protein
MLLTGPLQSQICITPFERLPSVTSMHLPWSVQAMLRQCQHSGRI